MEQLVQFDPGLIFWTWLTFLIVLTIVGTKAWRPMIDALDRREQQIRDALDEAKKARAETEQLQERHAESIQESRLEAQRVIADARASAEKLRADLEVAAKTNADELIQKAREQITAERDRALREIRTTVVDLSLSMAEKVLERNLNDADNRRLIEESLQQIGEA